MKHKTLKLNRHSNKLNLAGVSDDFLPGHVDRRPASSSRALSHSELVTAAIYYMSIKHHYQSDLMSHIRQFNNSELVTAAVYYTSIKHHYQSDLISDVRQFNTGIKKAKRHSPQHSEIAVSM